MSKTKLFKSLFVLLPDDDQKLMILVRDKKNQDAFKKLFDRYKDRVFSFSLQYVKKHSAAEEITQEVFMRVFKHAESFREEYKFKSWIFTIARNLSLDFLKKKKEVHLGASTEENMGIEDFVDESIGIEESLISQAESEMIQKCIDGLKDSQKEVLTLRIFSEESYSDIAKIMDKTEKSIKSLINRAKQNLLICMKNCMEEA